ncbi:L,D-transpeptidase [uncultured Leifsonia sp.]|uniref:L,D-transpeptidase n=1 Tax=Leifsonia sp. TaxID=1870902 RepID=UPI0028D39590|nr:L,D-transpeptidase [uncultured Leifsonia sp.]
MTWRLRSAATLWAFGVVALSGCTSDTPLAAPTTAGTTPAATDDAPPTLTSTQIIRLPAAAHDAVIPGLLTAPAEVAQATAHRLRRDAPLFGADRRTPIARLPAHDFLAERTVVTAIRAEGPWTLVLTPARSILPSRATAADPAPAQTAAWLPTAFLGAPGRLTDRIEISVSAQTLSIFQEGAATRTFPVGVGTPATPTPTNVTGYLQARYRDPDQGQIEHRIQLSSLHATGADEPYAGDDGGLIGIHFQETATGAVSHGCVRMDEVGISAVDALPLGTLIAVVE